MRLVALVERGTGRRAPGGTGAHHVAKKFTSVHWPGLLGEVERRAVEGGADHRGRRLADERAVDAMRLAAGSRVASTATRPMATATTIRTVATRRPRREPRSGASASAPGSASAASSVVAGCSGSSQALLTVRPPRARWPPAPTPGRAGRAAGPGRRRGTCRRTSAPRRSTARRSGAATITRRTDHARPRSRCRAAATGRRPRLRPVRTDGVPMAWPPLGNCEMAGS